MTTPEQMALKVHELMREVVGDRSSRVAYLSEGGSVTDHLDLRHRLFRAYRSEFSEDVAHRLAIHLTNWSPDVAFLFAMLTFPERFSDEELLSGIRCFIIDGAVHAAIVAKLLGWPVEKEYPKILENA